MQEALYTFRRYVLQTVSEGMYIFCHTFDILIWKFVWVYCKIVGNISGMYLCAINKTDLNRRISLLLPTSL